MFFRQELSIVHCSGPVIVWVPVLFVYAPQPLPLFLHHGCWPWPHHLPWPMECQQPRQEQEASRFGLVWFPVVYLKKTISQVSTGPSVLDLEKNTSGADLNPTSVDHVDNELSALPHHMNHATPNPCSFVM